jgi:hypothetical protein
MQNDIDLILANENKVTPSPKFLESVMGAVEREATTPPFAFPWLRALPGFIATIAALVAAIWNGIGVLTDPATNAVFNDQLREFTALTMSVGLQWIALAVAITFISLVLSSSLTGVSRSAMS